MEPLNTTSPSTLANQRLALALSPEISFSGKKGGLLSSPPTPSRCARPWSRLQLLSTPSNIQLPSRPRQHSLSEQNGSVEQKPRFAINTAMTVIGHRRQLSPGVTGLRSTQPRISSFKENSRPKDATKFVSVGSFQEYPTNTVVNLAKAILESDRMIGQNKVQPKGFFLRKPFAGQHEPSSALQETLEGGSDNPNQDGSTADSSPQSDSFCDTPTLRKGTKPPGAKICSKFKLESQTIKQEAEVITEKSQTVTTSQFRIKSCLKPPEKTRSLSRELRTSLSLNLEKPSPLLSTQVKPKKNVQFCRNAIIYFFQNGKPDVKSAFKFA